MTEEGFQRMSHDLLEVADAPYAPLEGLAPGSREAQERQRQTVPHLGLPLEVCTQKTGIVLRLIPAGSFVMGSPPSEGQRDADERPHQVTLTKAFYCGKFEVTQGQWEQVMGSNPSHFKNAGRDAPVEEVSWEYCQAFVKRLCQMEGAPEGTYRLLTEAEWEYVCRAGTETPFCYGSDLDPTMAKFSRDGMARRCLDNQTTRSVGFFPANAWGLHDMHGNVWEWCQDLYGAYWIGDRTDPQGPPRGDQHVIRGGCHLDEVQYCRSGARRGITFGRQSAGVGLRLARTAPFCAPEEPRQTSVESQRVEVERAQILRQISDDLTESVGAGYASLEGLAAGSAEAQARQREAVRELGLLLSK